MNNWNTKGYISKCKHKFCNSQVCTFKARELVSILLTQRHSSHEGAGCQQNGKIIRKKSLIHYISCGRWLLKSNYGLRSKGWNPRCHNLKKTFWIVHVNPMAWLGENMNWKLSLRSISFPIGKASKPLNHIRVPTITVLSTHNSYLHIFWGLL